MKWLCVPERKVFLTSGSPSKHLLFIQAVLLTWNISKNDTSLSCVIICTHWHCSKLSLCLQHQNAISVFLLNAALPCQRLLYLWTSTNQYPVYRVSEQVHKLYLSDLALCFSSFLFSVNLCHIRRWMSWKSLNVSTIPLGQILWWMYVILI